jgi:hypothetical protein
MTHHFSAYAIQPASLLLVLAFAASLFWCGEAACWSGTGDDQCASLICSLFANHNTPHEKQNGDCSIECMCVCHMQAIPGMEFDTEHNLTAQNTAFEITASAPSSPTQSVYHPPKS